ncbi:MAG: tyrosinase family protein [Bacteroidales bacterium]|nr:tyrosinase family protein [Bacteroidales bacterium]
MWNNQHLGQFDNASNWFVALNRSANGNNNLPTQSNVNGVLAISNWDNFNFNLETTNVHTAGHTWTGGIMGAGNSPWDPVFFFHHNSVDWIWQQWYDNGGDASYTVSLLANDLDENNHYLWPEDIDPDDINDSKTIGVFLQKINTLDFMITRLITNTGITKCFFINMK